MNLDRINELARKSKTEGLTEAEKEEQARIRKEQQRLEAEMQAEIEKEEKLRKAKEALAKKNKK